MDHIQPIVTVCSAVFGSLGVFGALYFVHQKSDDRFQKSDERWAALKTESDERWAALKTESDERFQKSDDRWAALKTESDNRWAKLLDAFCDFKNVTVDRFNKIENKNQQL